MTFLFFGGEGRGGVKKILRNTNGRSSQMLTFDDKGGGVKNPEPAHVIHGCSPLLYISNVHATNLSFLVSP